ncbi:uncharacterized protein LOC111260104 isoform X1 [Varroa jacobsoni]|uniref:uncharacterized protein LOC111260104 isoform X1 n=1 Tax=Varroa jacobsoni TaxID=62625 RepID=UPI000BF8F2A4|nr:uncharacterized protein LOC111260104 isoform X1 [Varroa jacobsoni]
MYVHTVTLLTNARGYTCAVSPVPANSIGQSYIINPISITAILHYPSCVLLLNRHLPPIVLPSSCQVTFYNRHYNRNDTHIVHSLSLPEAATTRPDSVSSDNLSRDCETSGQTSTVRRLIISGGSAAKATNEQHLYRPDRLVRSKIDIGDSPPPVSTTESPQSPPSSCSASQVYSTSSVESPRDVVSKDVRGLVPTAHQQSLAAAGIHPILVQRRRASSKAKKLQTPAISNAISCDTNNFTTVINHLPRLSRTLQFRLSQNITRIISCSPGTQGRGSYKKPKTRNRQKKLRHLAYRARSKKALTKGAKNTRLCNKRSKQRALNDVGTLDSLAPRREGKLTVGPNAISRTGPKSHHSKYPKSDKIEEKQTASIEREREKQNESFTDGVNQPQQQDSNEQPESAKGNKSNKRRRDTHQYTRGHSKSRTSHPAQYDCVNLNQCLVF